MDVDIRSSRSLSVDVGPYDLEHGCVGIALIGQFVQFMAVWPFYASGHSSQEFMWRALERMMCLHKG